MAKLWDKGIDTDEMVSRFTVGDDYLVDMNLVTADVLGNIAHARTLYKLDFLTIEELHRIEDALRLLLDEYRAGTFEILPEQEDVHTAVENYLVDKVGDIGKKIHAGRSRNDQAICDMRIYMRNKALVLTNAVLDTAQEALYFADRHWDVPMPGYTHTRAAMPSSVGLWASCLGELLLDDLMILGSAYALLDQCPLGSAAGYGVNIKLDRQFTAEQLGFPRPQKNTLAVQNSRGKFELALLNACQVIMIDLSRTAADIIFFSQPELGFIGIPDNLTTGSSIMPQKKNPDVLELIRARTSEVTGACTALAGIVAGLPSGYQRDLQLTKEPTLRGLETTLSCVEVMGRMFKGLVVDEDKCVDAFSPDLYAADAALDVALQRNIPFRDAYKFVAENIGNIETGNPRLIFKGRIHLGAPGNLGLHDEHKRLDRHRLVINQYIRNADAFVENLLNPFEPEPEPEKKKE